MSYLVANPEDRFSHDAAQLRFGLLVSLRDLPLLPVEQKRRVFGDN